jgi:dTMP kinase
MGRELDRFEQEKVEFFERVRAAYLERARAAPRRIHLIDGGLSVSEIGVILEEISISVCK